MTINMTLLGQMITFAIFIWFTMKYVWPPMEQAMEERKKNIAEGIAKAARGEKMLEEASAKVRQELDGARVKAASVVERANQQAVGILENARKEAKEEADRIVSLAEEDARQAYLQAKAKLSSDLARLALAGAEKILRAEIDEEKHRQMVKAFADKLSA